MERNGPPVVAPGFGSHVSSCDAPPASHNRMTRFCDFLSALFTSGAASALSAVMSAARVAPAASAPPKTARRSMAWAAEPQKVLRGMSTSLVSPSTAVDGDGTSVAEPEFCTGHERPEHLPVGFGLAVLTLLNVGDERLRFLRGRGAAVGGFHQEL